MPSSEVPTLRPATRRGDLALILAKRYSLDNSREGESLHLFYPRRLAPVSVRGTTLDEQIRYRIYLPEGLEAVMKERAAATSVPE